MNEEWSNSRKAFTEHKIAVVIPTFNNERTLAKVIHDVLIYTDHVIVVNDGSTDSTLEIVRNLPVEVVTYSKNQGKGYAIQCGFKKALELGYEYAITIDSDGQHFTDDLKQFVQSLSNHPNAIIIGARNMNQSGIPGKSSFGNKFSNFWFWFETGLRLPDTQSGYRLYPIKSLSAIRFYTRKYEFEIEVLVRSYWRGIDVTSVPVKVAYPEDRVSHFRPFKDFSRISVLNTVLVTLTILYIKPRNFFRSFRGKKIREIINEHLLNGHHSNAIKATSMGFGVLMGIVPIWGFQLMVAIALAIIFRLNKALVVIAANISIPPCIPFILYASMFTGSFFVDSPVLLPNPSQVSMEFIKQSLTQYFLGSIVLALVAGLLVGFLTYGFLFVTKRKTSVSNQIAS
jgi:glycosyltransferase involved in cell wall biosynthesis